MIKRDIDAVEVEDTEGDIIIIGPIRGKFAVKINLDEDGEPKKEAEVIPKPPGLEREGER